MAVTVTPVRHSSDCHPQRWGRRTVNVPCFPCQTAAKTMPSPTTAPPAMINRTQGPPANPPPRIPNEDEFGVRGRKFVSYAYIITFLSRARILHHAFLYPASSCIVSSLVFPFFFSPHDSHALYLTAFSPTCPQSERSVKNSVLLLRAQIVSHTCVRVP